jgi:CRP-like cAMP-binding protein
MPPSGQNPSSVDLRKNRLLASLEQAGMDALLKAGKVVSCKFRQRLYRQDESIKFVYFPLTCMVSLLVTDGGKPSIEMATVGREGVVGASELIQSQGAIGLSIIQLPGTAVRIAADAFLRLVNSRPEMPNLMSRHLYALMRQVLIGAACNRLHTMEQRCARWLLMTHDRAGEAVFPLTQEFMAHMLGVRRATVSEATGGLKKASLIRYVRGQVTIVDRSGLEAAACSCYAATIKAYEAVLPLAL